MKKCFESVYFPPNRKYSFIVSLFLHFLIFVLLTCISFLFSVSLRRAFQSAIPCLSTFTSKSPSLQTATLQFEKSHETQKVTSFTDLEPSITSQLPNIVKAESVDVEENREIKENAPVNELKPEDSSLSQPLPIGSVDLKENPEHCQNLFRKSRKGPWRSFRFGPLRVHDIGGWFRGMGAFLDALTKDLNPDPAKPVCDVYFKGDIHPVPRHWDLEHCKHVIVIVHGEDQSNSQAWETIKKKFRLKPSTFIIGNWWDEKNENYTDETVSSMWVPFASINFSERKANTPMDLIKRPDFDNANKRKPVAYQQRRCYENRETFWDDLNEKLSRELNLKGSALSECNGEKQLGIRESLPLKELDYDKSVDHYRDFIFTLNMEHNMNDVGYITEKIVDGFLAGSIPIYTGSSQISSVFKESSFIHVENREDSLDKIIELLKKNNSLQNYQHASVISDASVRRFFSWHPSVWYTYGDQLRRDIWEEILRKCELGSQELFPD